MKHSRVVLSLLLAAVLYSPGMRCHAFEPPGTEEQAAVDKANKTLDGVYHELMAKGDDQEQTSLREAQRAWIKWRDAEAMYMARHGGAIGGSALRVDYANAQLKIINERISVLKACLSQPPAN